MPEPLSQDGLLEELKLLWQSDPSSKVYLQLVEEHRRLGQTEEAIKVLETSLAHRPRDPRGRVALARCRMDLGEAAEATRLLEEVVRLDPANAVANKLLLEGLLQIGDGGRAAERLNIYRLLNDRDAELDHLEFRLRRLQGQAHEDSEAVAIVESPSTPSEVENVFEAALVQEAPPLIAAGAQEVTAPTELPKLSLPGLSTQNVIVPARDASPAAVDEPKKSTHSSSHALIEDFFASTVAQQVTQKIKAVALPNEPAEPPSAPAPVAKIADPFGELLAPLPGVVSLASSDPFAELLGGTAQKPFVQEPLKEAASLFAFETSASSATVEPQMAFANPADAPALDAPFGDLLGPALLAEAPVDLFTMLDEPDGPAPSLDSLWNGMPGGVGEVSGIFEIGFKVVEKVEPTPALPPIEVSEIRSAAEPLAPMPTWEAQEAIPSAEPADSLWSVPAPVAESWTTDATAHSEATPAPDEIAEPPALVSEAAHSFEVSGPTPEPAVPFDLSDVGVDSLVESHFEDQVEAPQDVPVDSGSEAHESPATATLAHLYLQQGHVDEAARIFAQILEREPLNSSASAGLSHIRRLRSPRLTAASLLSDRSIDRVPEGLTAKKILVLKQYLQHLRRAGETHVH